MPLAWGTLKGYTWCQTAVSDRTGLAGEPWLSVHFMISEHTMAAFLFKDLKKCLKFQQHWLASYNYNSLKILAMRLLYLYSKSGVHALKHQIVEYLKLVYLEIQNA